MSSSLQILVTISTSGLEIQAVEVFSKLGQRDLSLITSEPPSRERR
jgi:hypothetical protein